MIGKHNKVMPAAIPIADVVEEPALKMKAHAHKDCLACRLLLKHLNNHLCGTKLAGGIEDCAGERGAKPMAPVFARHNQLDIGHMARPARQPPDCAIAG